MAIERGRLEEAPNSPPVSPTIAEWLEHARKCEWYAARTNDEAGRKFLLWRAQELKKRADEMEREASPRTAA